MSDFELLRNKSTIRIVGWMHANCNFETNITGLVSFLNWLFCCNFGGWLLQVVSHHWPIIALILLLTLMDHVQTPMVLVHLIGC